MLVVGATGGTGREIVRQALERGLEVTALVRGEGARGAGEGGTRRGGTATGDAGRAGLPEGVRIVHGEIGPDVVAGHDAVVSALGVPVGQPIGTIRSTATRALVEAMEAESVRRLVSVSSIGVGESVAAMSGPARYFWPRIVGRDRLAEVERADRVIRESTLDWTIVQPPRLVDELAGDATLGGRLRLGSQLSRAQLAGVLLDALADPTTIGRVLWATGN